jgi:hypothetical protein
MTEAITFSKVLNKSDWDELRSFAASFSHTIDDKTRTPMFAIRRGEKLFGYFSVAPFPILFPCFRPESTTPRDFIEAVSQIRAWQWLMTSGHDRYPKGIVQFAMGDSNPETKRALRQMGCYKVGELWESVP